LEGNFREKAGGKDKNYCSFGYPKSNSHDKRKGDQERTTKRGHKRKKRGEEKRGITNVGILRRGTQSWGGDYYTLLSNIIRPEVWTQTGIPKLREKSHDSNRAAHKKKVLDLGTLTVA